MESSLKRATRSTVVGVVLECPDLFCTRGLLLGQRHDFIVSEPTFRQLLWTKTSFGGCSLWKMSLCGEIVLVTHPLIWMAPGCVICWIWASSASFCPSSWFLTYFLLIFPLIVASLYHSHASLSEFLTFKHCMPPYQNFSLLLKHCW